MLGLCVFSYWKSIKLLIRKTTNNHIVKRELLCLTGVKALILAFLCYAEVNVQIPVRCVPICNHVALVQTFKAICSRLQLCALKLRIL